MTVIFNVPVRSVAAISQTVARAEARRGNDRRWDRTLSKLENAVVELYVKI